MTQSSSPTKNNSMKEIIRMRSIQLRIFELSNSQSLSVIQMQRLDVIDREIDKLIAQMKEDSV